jgi:hypothetical protein
MSQPVRFQEIQSVQQFVLWRTSIINISNYFVSKHNNFSRVMEQKLFCRAATCYFTGWYEHGEFYN